MTDRRAKHAEDYKAFEAGIISDFDAQSAVERETGTATAQWFESPEISTWPPDRLSVHFSDGLIRSVLDAGSGFIRQLCRFELDSLPDDAVHCEPVSASNSLLPGKITGNSPYWPPIPILVPLRPANSKVRNEIPWTKEQGIIFTEQGNILSETRNLAAETATTVVPYSVEGSSIWAANNVRFSTAFKPLRPAHQSV